MRTKQKFRKLAVQFTEYMVAGGAWFWVGYASFAVMDKVFLLPFWPTKISSYIIGASVNFLLQKYWVFRGNSSGTKQLGEAAKRYYSLMVLNFVLDQAIVGGLRAIGVTPYIGQFVASGFFTVWNWLWYSLWVFRRQKKEPIARAQHAPLLHRNKHVHTVPATRRKSKLRR